MNASRGLQCIFPPVHSVNKVFLLKVTLSLIYKAHSFHVTRCCNSQRCSSSTDAWPWPSLRQRWRSEREQKPRHFVNSSVLKCFPSMLHGIAFDLQLAATVICQWILNGNGLEMQFGFSSCNHVVFVHKQGWKRKPKTLCEIFTGLAQQSVWLASWQLLSANWIPWFILVYCQHNRWQADESTPKN